MKAGAPADPNDLRLQAHRAVALGPAAGWRAQVQLAALQPASEDAALGLVLVATTGTMLGVMLRPREGDMVVSRQNDPRWQKTLGDEADALVLASDAAAVHMLQASTR